MLMTESQIAALNEFIKANYTPPGMVFYQMSSDVAADKSCYQIIELADGCKEK